MKKTTMAIAVAMIFVAGCTRPAQRVAQVALDVQNRQYDTIHRDLLEIAKQATLESANNQVQQAVQASDPQAAQAAVEGMATEWDKLCWLDHEWCKVRYGVTQLAQMYVWQQQGILNILQTEWSRAQKDVSARTQPAP